MFNFKNREMKSYKDFTNKIDLNYQGIDLEIQYDWQAPDSSCGFGGQLDIDYVWFDGRDVSKQFRKVADKLIDALWDKFDEMDKDRY